MINQLVIVESEMFTVVNLEDIAEFIYRNGYLTVRLDSGESKVFSDFKMIYKQEVKENAGTI